MWDSTPTPTPTNQAQSTEHNSPPTKLSVAQPKQQHLAPRVGAY